MTEVESMDDDELAALREAVMAETDRRRTLSEASVAADELSQRVAVASGVPNGADWKQPVVVGLPIGWEVTHGGKRWRSTTPNNVWEPGVSGWREVMADGTPPPFRPPTGAHDAYEAGELITWTDGKVYAAVRGGVTHSPAEAATEWRLVKAPPVEEPPVDEPPVDNPGDPDMAEWAPGVFYTVDQLITYNGQTYRVIQAHTSAGHWLPPDLTVLYALVNP